MKRHSSNYTPFPSALLLNNIPQTVVACYSEDEKQSLFSDVTISHMSDTVSTTTTSSPIPTMIEAGFVRTLFSAGSDDEVHSFINALKDTQRMEPRTSTDAFCVGCGKYGHDIYHQGCDFCAQLGLALKFLEKNLKQMKQIIRDYMSFQRKGKKHKYKNSSSPTVTQTPYRKRNIKATVRAIQSALTNIVDGTSSSDEEDQFVDAASNNQVE